MTRHAIQHTGVYEERDAAGQPTGRFWARPRLHRRTNTWRLLAATTRKKAIAEVANTTFASTGDHFKSVASLYANSGCPTKKSHFTRNPKDYCTAETWRIGKLNDYFARRPVGSIQLPDLLEYHRYRVRSMAKGRGGRAVDKETQTLSNVLNYAVFITKQIPTNPIRENRPRFQKRQSCARDRMPADADTIHNLAEYFFANIRSEVFGWLSFFTMFTGCRHNELLRLRRDARQLSPVKFEPGYIQRQLGQISPIYPDTRALLHLHRSKGGINPWAVVGPEFDDMLRCFEHWHRSRFDRTTAAYFPGADGEIVVSELSFGHALTRACAKLRLPHVSPHGFRAYYATKRLRDLIPAPIVAAEIGDVTVSLLSSTYAESPGLARLHWRPETGLPTWLQWQPTEQKVVRLRQS